MMEAQDNDRRRERVVLDERPEPGFGRVIDAGLVFGRLRAARRLDARAAIEGDDLGAKLRRHAIGLRLQAQAMARGFGQPDGGGAPAGRVRA